MDEFKKYLQENRAALDLDEPGPQSWEKVQARLKQERPTAKVVAIKKYFQWSVAACVFVLAGIGLWSLLDSKSETLHTAIFNVITFSQFLFCFWLVKWVTVSYRNARNHENQET